MSKNHILSVILGAMFFIFAARAEAAILFMSPKSGELKIGQTFNLDIKVNTEGKAFNAAEATIQFPKDVLEVKSVDISPAATIFNFWLEGPDFSNKDGKITFIGGTTNGISGSSISILRIVFGVKGAGAADIVFSDAAVTASDGSGTNILSTMEIARLTVSPAVVAPTTEPVAPKVVIPIPTPITRPAVKARNLPEKPKLSIDLYPNEEKWYNLSADFLVKWELPQDISDLNAAIDRNFSYFNQKSDGLFESKVFPAIVEDGVWYLHARFKNNVGWGPVATYRIGIDTHPPQPFEIKFIEGFFTDNPAPTIQFRTNDGLSGLENYLVRIDGGELITLPPDASSFKLPVQPPRKHQVLVMAMDKAGNLTESAAELEIIPISSPTLNLVSKNIFIGEGGLSLRGTSLPDTTILIWIKDKNNEIVIETKVLADKNGSWNALIDQPLKKGQYFVEIIAQDGRGALSLPVKSDLITVREKPLFILGGFEVTQFWFFTSLIIILLIGFSGGWFSYRLWKAQVGRRSVIAQRDIITSFNLIKKDIDKMLENFSDKKIQEHEASEIEFLLKKLKENLEKTEKYLIENIEEIPE